MTFDSTHQTDALQADVNETSALYTETTRQVVYRVGLKIHTFYFPFVALLGLIGNVLSLFILLKKRNRQFPCYRTLTALSLSDIIIIGAGIYYWIIILCDAMTETHCKVWTYLFQSAALSSSLMAGFVTIHKYLAFLSPFKSHNWRSPERTLKIIALIVTVSLSLNVVHIYTKNTVEEKVCVGITGESRALSWVVLGLNTLFPVVTVVTMNVLIIKALRESNEFCQSSASIKSKSVNDRGDKSFLEEPKKEAKNQGKDPLRHYNPPTANYHKNSAVLLVAVTLAFAGLTPPLFIFYVVSSHVAYDTDAEDLALYVSVFFICM